MENKNLKNSNLITGTGFLFMGIILLLITLLTDSVLDDLLLGFACGAICSGIVTICKYFYWNKPENRERYQKKIENENIEMHDELKVKLRDQSGRFAYVLGLMVISISIVIFSILGKLEMVADSRTIILYLGGYLVFQIIVPFVFYHMLMKKY